MPFCVPAGFGQVCVDFVFFESCMMCLKSACLQCLVRAEGAVFNDFAGDFESNVYMFKGSLGVKSPTIWTDEKQGREE